MGAKVDYAVKLSDEFYSLGIVKSAVDWSTIGESLAGIAALWGFVPVIGDATADAAMTLFYLFKKDFFEAACWGISLVPEIGDAAGKGMLSIKWLLSKAGAPGVNSLLVKWSAQILNFCEWAKKIKLNNPQAAQLLKSAWNKAATMLNINWTVDYLKPILSQFGYQTQSATVEQIFEDTNLYSVILTYLENMFKNQISWIESNIKSAYGVT